MVNYKRVVCVLAVVAVAAAAPADCREPHYDQRQNGTENYRLNIDGVVIAVAPADSLLEAASDIDFSDLFDLEDLEQYKPKPPPSAVSSENPLESKPEEPKPPGLKPEAAEVKPEAVKPEEPLSNIKLSDDLKGQKKEAPSRKHEKGQRLKNRLAHILMPFLRKTRHH